MNKTTAIVLGIILVLAIAGGSFYGGMVYGKSQAQASITARRGAFQNGAPGDGAPGQPGAVAGRTQGGMLMGTIKEIGDGTFTLTDNNGKDTQVKVTDTTLIEKNASVKLTDLTDGETLLVSGSTGTDGTVTARSIQVAPRGRFGSEQGAPNAGPTPAK